MARRILIQGAAGRDFHNFNTVFRGNRQYHVVGFTAAQIPNIDGRKYPAKLAGTGYPKGIPIFAEDEIESLIKRLDVDEVVFSYSDVSHVYVMHQASRALSSGADFRFLGPKETMLESKRPVIAVCAVRTGSGKSQTTRYVCSLLKRRGLTVVAIRHPMPYGDLNKQVCQRYASMADLDKYDCTIEEREEYEPHIASGTIIYAGIDYEMILRKAEQEADVIVWDGGNNDMAFYKAGLYITVADPHRAGHEITYHPGETNLKLADVVVINKIDTAPPEGVNNLRRNIAAHNPKATVVDAASPISVEDPKVITGKRVLVIEDGPTLTHGEMKYGAGVVAAQRFGASAIVDPRPWVKGTIKETFEQYPNIGPLLPAMGYGDKQIADLQATINAADVDSVIIATPIDLRRLVKIKKPSVRVRYDLQVIGRPTLEEQVDGFLSRFTSRKSRPRSGPRKKRA
jgi:predicted GTPase